MADAPQTVFVTTNAALLAAAVVLTILVLGLASRHAWLIAYGPQQARIRFWMAVVLLLLVFISLGATIFNLIFV